MVRQQGGRLHHVSLAVHSRDGWWDEAEDPAEWSFGFAALEVFRLLWVDDPEEAARYSGPGLPVQPGNPNWRTSFPTLASSAMRADPATSWASGLPPERPRFFAPRY